MERNAVVAKMEREGYSSSPCFLKYLQIPGHSGPEQERAAVTILKGEKRDSWPAANYARDRENWKGKIRGEQMFDTQYQRGNLYCGC